VLGFQGLVRGAEQRGLDGIQVHRVLQPGGEDRDVATATV